MTGPTPPTPRYVTLRDYLRVLRRYWIMIAALAVIGACAGYVVATRQKPVYVATAEVNFQDPNQAVGLLGLGSNTADTPAQIASVSAETITGNAIMSRVRRELRSTSPVGSLASAISTETSQQSGLLGIVASGSTASFAARLANAVAAALVAQTNQQTRAKYATLAADVRRQISQLPRSASADGPYGPLAFYENELAKAQTLATYATSVQVTRLAQPPAAPNSPHRSRSALLGLALGLLLGVIVAFVRDSVDRRLRRPQDVDASFRLPLLGYVGKRSMGRVPYTSGSPRNDGRLDLEQFRILRRNVELLDHERPPRCILVTSAIPEEGKTTVASSLAFVMASAGKRTLLVDCDLRRPAIAQRLGLASAPGISEYLAGIASPEEILRTIEFTEPGTSEGAPGWSNGHSAGNGRASRNGQAAGNGHNAPSASQRLVCIPGGTPAPRAAELLGSTLFKQFLAEVIDTYDVVILDSSPLLSVADTLEIAPHVDAILICARESRTTHDQAVATRAALTRLPEKPAGVVVTGVKAPAEAGIYAYSYAYG